MNRIRLITMTLLVVSVISFGQGRDNSIDDAKKSDGMMGSEEQPGEGGVMMMMSSGGKVEYTNLADARMLARTGPTVLFFHAGWCPLCRADMKQIDSRVKELGNITVVIVDYDRNPELRKKYAVTYQHTYVQIDTGGDPIALWSGGGVDGILKNVVLEGM